MTIEAVVKTYLENKIAGYAAEIAEFAEKLSKNPVHAFSWADSAMKAAAQSKVYTDALNALNSGVTVETLRAKAMKSALFGAQHPESGSSAASNIMDQLVTAAHAELFTDAFGG